MKALAFLVVAAALILTAHVAYDSGKQEQRDFETLCESPGVQCVIRFSPAYLQNHKGVELEQYVTGEWIEGDGRMR